MTTISTATKLGPTNEQRGMGRGRGGYERAKKSWCLLALTRDLPLVLLLQKLRVNLPHCCCVESCSRPRRARRCSAMQPDISSSGITRRPAEMEPRRFWKLKANVRWINNGESLADLFETSPEAAEAAGLDETFWQSYTKSTVWQEEGQRRGALSTQ